MKAQPKSNMSVSQSLGMNVRVRIGCIIFEGLSLRVLWVM